MRHQQLKSSEELELEALAAVPKFRAKPVRKAVLEGAAAAAGAAAGGAAGVGAVAAGAQQVGGRAAQGRAPTQPVGFRLATEERAAHHAHEGPAAAAAAALPRKVSALPR